DATIPGNQADLAGLGNPSDSLDGTWDVATTLGSQAPSMFTITIAGEAITITGTGTTVSFTPTSNGTTLVWGGTTVTGMHTGSGSHGVVPIDPFGDWVFSDAKGSNTSSITASGGTSTCTPSCGNPVTGSDFLGKVTATKMPSAAGSSTWGDLAGAWHIADTN